MCRTLCLVLVPFFVMAGGRSDLLKARTVINDDGYQSNTAPAFAVPPAQPSEPTASPFDWGRTDTVGGTTYDWQANGPSGQQIVTDARGVHVTWLYSAEMANHADRNIRYNYYDFARQRWNFGDSGANVFSTRSGFGNLDVNSTTGNAYICSYNTNGPVVARDAAPGAGVFSECPGDSVTEGFKLPVMCLTQSGKPHVALAPLSGSGLFYSRIDPWCTWSAPESIAPDLSSPTCLVQGSKHSGKVVITWVYGDPDPTQPVRGYYVQSADDGLTWAGPVQIPFPPAFTPGSETLPTFHISGISPLLDTNDELHVVAAVAPIIDGTTYIMPAEIWHWYQPLGEWSRVARHDCDTGNLEGYVGYNALYADRPTLCGGLPGEFICVWEEFDSMNVEPATGLMRAVIRAARSLDNGLHWTGSTKLTEPSTASDRFPCVAPRIWHDSLFFTRYMTDQVAGFGIAPYEQGPITNNPIVVYSDSKSDFPMPSVAESPPTRPNRLTVSVNPNPFRGRTVVGYDLPMVGHVCLRICDVSGRTVATLVDGIQETGIYRRDWQVPPGTPNGVFFLSLETAGHRESRKLILSR
jgi:hypothetical protein